MPGFPRQRAWLNIRSALNAQNFGPYQLLKKLATGGMAEVFLARHSGIEGFQRLLVIKRILPHLADDPEFVQMFLNEARIAARFNHPNIAQIYDLGDAHGTYYIGMEYVHGEDLGRVMRKAWSSGQWIARPLAIRIVASACEALFYAHTRNDERGNPLRVVHRDISPQNILISFDGSVKLVDFGIAKAADAQNMTRSGAIKGKFAYMSPEQAGGRPLDARSDIFAAGLVLYELLTGVRPLKRENEIATLQAALECRIEPPSKVADVPPELDAVVMNALAKSADHRYRDARAFQMALEELLVQQRWVATSVQLSELMATLFRDRLEQEAKLGYPAPPEEPSQSSPVVPVMPRTDPGTGSGEVSWDAPPALGKVREPPRTLARSSTRPSRENLPALAPPAPEPDPVLPWDAPPAAEIPGPRRQTGENPTQVARSASRPEVRSAEGPPPRRTTSRTGPADPPPRRTRTGAVKLLDVDDERTVMPDDGELPGPRRKSVIAAMSARRQSGLEMPEAPPRLIVASDDDDLDEATRATASSSGPSVPNRRTKRARPVILNVVATAALGVILAGAGVVFRAPLTKFLTSTANDSAELLVSVDSNEPVDVYVEHHPDEGRAQRLVLLGRNPLKGVRGIHARDVLVLENKSLGIYDRMELPSGQPGEHKEIVREFQKGRFKFNFAPKSVRELSLFVAGQERGRWTPGLPIEFVEGKHTVEIRGPQLARPAVLQIEVRPGVTTEGKVVDLTRYLK